MSETEPTAKAIPTFESSLEAVCQRYGFSDWAFVVRALDGNCRAKWVAGDGKSIVKDRERALLLHGEMSALQDSLITELKTPRLL